MWPSCHGAAEGLLHHLRHPRLGGEDGPPEQPQFPQEGFASDPFLQQLMDHRVTRWAPHGHLMTNAFSSFVPSKGQRFFRREKMRGHFAARELGQIQKAADVDTNFTKFGQLHRALHGIHCFKRKSSEIGGALIPSN